MKTIKVSEATNLQLDWLVAKCEGRTPSLHEYSKGQGDWFILMQTGVYRTVCAFSTEWSQMGPISEREHIGAEWFVSGWKAAQNYAGQPYKDAPHLSLIGVRHVTYGATRLVAEARCYVASKLGDTVEVPKELG